MHKKKKSRIIFLLLIATISLSSLFFIITNFRENIIFFYSPTDLKGIKEKVEIFRLGGLVKQNSVKKPSSDKIEFILTDNQEEILVKYQGIIPDLFREEQGMVGRGILKNGVFIAKELLVKHDENYMPPEVYKTLKSKKTSSDIKYSK
jgi:cytochrome c-type biogenesis protein CcmE